ncbi:hypothetical protein ACFC01_08380 [Streptomyces mirabilis]
MDTDDLAVMTNVLPALKWVHEDSAVCAEIDTLTSWVVEAQGTYEQSR